jgi:hypothetical protein
MVIWRLIDLIGFLNNDRPTDAIVKDVSRDQIEIGKNLFLNYAVLKSMGLKEDIVGSDDLSY